jgi:hypothetical protein
MGFWHNYTGGQGTWSDRIIAGLKEAQDAGTPNPYPNRILKNTAEFPERDKSDLRGHSAWADWPWKLHRIQPQTGAKVTWELYQLEDDPQEGNQSRRTASRESGENAHRSGGVAEVCARELVWRRLREEVNPLTSMT